MSSDPPAKGARRLQIGKYHVIAHIATGGMGAVYKAVDTQTGEQVALKVLQHDLAARPALLERFRREARHGEKLNHENIVRLLECGELSGTHYLALEFVEGIDLHDYITRKGQVGVKESEQIILQAAKALAHLHQLGIVHRDIKPSNFLVAETNGKPRVKLIDLGLARDIDDEEFRVTRAGSTVGTVDYMAPEQAKDSGKADIRSDIYALGCTWYHMLAGRAPFAEGSLTERLYKHVESPPPDINKFNRKVPNDLIEIMNRMLAKDPRERYQTPEALIRDLELGRNSAKPIQSDLLANLALADDEIAEPPAAKRRPRPGSRETVEIKRRSPTPVPDRPNAADKFRAKSPLRTPGASVRGSQPSAAETKAAPVSTGLGDSWWPWAAGIAGVLVLASVVVWLALRPGHKTSPPIEEPNAGGVKPNLDIPGVTIPKPEPVKRPDADVVKHPDLSQPGALPRLYQPTAGVDEKAMRQEYERPWAGSGQPVLSGPTLQVCRGRGGQGDRLFDSLAAACAAAPPDQETVIEIQDNGPLFELPISVQGRSLIVKAGKGYRPLVVWDVQHPPTSRITQFLTVSHGNLTLEDIDVVVKCFDMGQSQPPVLFAVKDGNLTARGCTMSIAGKHRAGVAACRLEKGKANTPSGKLRLNRCILRGAELIALDLRAGAAEVLLDGCLIVGGERPLLDVAGYNGEQTTLRVARSTLIAGQTLLRVRPATPTDTIPALNWFGWDALLARAGYAGGGEMVVLRDLASTAGMTWRPTNCFYTGWKTLGSFPDKNFGEVVPWRVQWKYDEGDYALPDPWPAKVHPDPAEALPAKYRTTGTTAAFLDTSGKGMLGCDLDALPPARDNWLGLTYEQFARPQLPLPIRGPAPAIASVTDGSYQGDDINLDKVADPDLSVYLDYRQKIAKMGRKVVLRLSGTGEKKLNQPIRVKGFTLVLYFEPTKDKASPLVLVGNLPPENAAEALIDVEDGSLEILGGTIRFVDAKTTRMPTSLIRVRGGNLSLAGCRLESPLSQPPASFQNLVRFEGSGNSTSEKANGCAVNEAILLSGRNCFQIVGEGARLRLEKSVLVAGGHAIVFDPGNASRPRLNVQCSVAQSTLAAQGAAFHLGNAPNLSVPAEPIIVQAKTTVFLDPFKASSRKSGLLLYDGDALSRGLFVWQGQGNAYDKRLQHFAASTEAAGADKPLPHAAWARLWGTVGEVGALVDLPLVKTLDLQNPKTLSFDCLSLPATVKTSAGADLVGLKMIKKTGK